MEYIRKENGKFLATEGHDIKVDNITIFHSRCNFKGAGGKQVKINLDDYCIEWVSNFGYGSWSGGSAFVNFKNIFIRHYEDITTTSKFVNILNLYLKPKESEKDKIIFELANRLAHFRELAETNVYNSFGVNASHIKPIADFKDLMSPFDFKAYKKFESTIKEHNELENSINEHENDIVNTVSLLQQLIKKNKL